MKKQFVSWRRVSTFRQSKSGLGLEAQKEIIRYFVERDNGELVADYSECYTGKELSGCVELRKAIDHAKRENAVLIIAKSDRFRNTVEALQIYEEMGEGNIMFCDLPHTDKFTLTLFFALSEREALIVSIRTKQALAVKKKYGQRLGAASDKYKASMAAKGEAAIADMQKRKGCAKTKRHLESKDSQAFLKAIHRVFPDHTTDEDPRKWEWAGIRLRCGYLEKTIEVMRDFHDMNPEIFSKWDFSSDKIGVRLRAHLCNFKKSILNTNNN